MYKYCFFLISSIIVNFSFCQNHFHAESELSINECLSDSLRNVIKRENIESMKKLGIYEKRTLDNRMVVSLGWPLKQSNGFNDPSYWLISNFVDHNPGSGILDYNCGNRTYNGHMGTDFAVWPFMWQKMNVDQVDVVASEAGVIINKSDGNFDQNCTCTGTWNAIYIKHNDGSVAWYGHFKSFTLTSKSIGQSVAKGEYLGKVGSSGCSTGPHLHFELYANPDQTILIDPYTGSCNNLNGSTSWWANQSPYIDPALLRISIYDCVPNQSDGCPANNYDMCEQSNFYPGNSIRFGTHYRMQQAGVITNHVVKDPTGAVFISWDQNPTSSFNYGSWWYWSFTLPLNIRQGIWSYEVTYNGETTTKNFNVFQKNRNNVGISESNPSAKLEVSGGDIYLDNLDAGVIVRSPNGKCWRLTVNNSGNVISTSVACPDPK
ncbi:MAG: hypothetical protein RLZZ546_710 [Bacteroidota bacterium]|jgi:murein DD-endopeptidase MepM/ murein hydrolase activator NlpD